MKDRLEQRIEDGEAGHVFRRPKRSRSFRRLLSSLCILSFTLLVLNSRVLNDRIFERRVLLPPHAPQILTHCRDLHTLPGPPADFYDREESDRFVPGTSPVLIVNATIWSGFDGGKETFSGDVLLDKGLIKWIGRGLSTRNKSLYGQKLIEIDAEGAWLTPGIVDIHSHVGVASSPSASGTNDGNSLHGNVQPWLRSLDGLNTHDDAYKLAMAGGVTTSLILPGSANSIGGQAFVMKLRPTAERSPTSMLLEPPFNLNGSELTSGIPPRWRHMKHACGENPSSAYSQTRMDSVWQTRQGYNTAKQIKEAQDEYCSKALAGEWQGLGKFPESLQWEALVDILRGKVKVQTHCYTAVDLDNFVRLTNEFKFPVAAFHHAHETYLVPDVLKRAHGDKPPASAIFASLGRYKAEAYRHSEFAPRILHDNGLRVIMKSDHSAIVSRYLLHEAQQAHYYGLPAHVALSSVISTPAEVMGLDHRIGFIQEGFDADLVLWDSHPLALGATPFQTFVDGIPQLDGMYFLQKPAAFQVEPKTPNFDKETKETIKFEGLPPLEVEQRFADELLTFTNVSSVWVPSFDGVSEVFSTSNNDPCEAPGAGTVVTQNGKILCAGFANECAHVQTKGSRIVDLKGGAITPGLVHYGSKLGMQHIALEESTADGIVYDTLTGSVPQIIGTGGVIRAVDGLQFQSRDALLAYRSGVTSAVVSPLSGGMLEGLSVAFSTGVANILSPGAVVQEVAALHFVVEHDGTTSISTKIAILRNLFLNQAVVHPLVEVVVQVIKGEIPLVIQTQNADIITTLLMLKKEIEAKHRTSIRLTIVGGSEAHLLAKELGQAGVGVILNPVRPYPYFWESRRIIAGPPLTRDSMVLHLLKNNVAVGFGVMGIDAGSQLSTWSSRNTRFDIGWAAIEARGKISQAEAIALGSTNVQKLLGISANAIAANDLVATEGGNLFSFEGKVVGVISSKRGVVEIL